MSSNAPNVDVNEDVSSTIISSAIVCMVLAGLAVMGRFTSRRMMRTSLLASDFLVIGGLAGAWIISLIFIEEARLGLGRHIEVVSSANVRQILIDDFVIEIFYALSFAMIKISILLLYRGLFPGKDIVFATNIIGAFVILWGIAVLLVSVFSCKPIHGYWDITIKSTCVSTKWFFLGTSIPNILADVMILALPVRRVWHLKMPKRSKFIVSGIFLLGGFVVIASAVQTYFMMRMDLSDITWTYVDVCVWSTVGINVAVICACLPTIRPVMSYLVPSFLSDMFCRGQRPADSENSVQDLYLVQHLPKLDSYEIQRLPEHASGQ